MLGLGARDPGRLDDIPEVLLSELAGLVVLLAGLGALGLTGALVACCLQFRSPLELALATYVVSWSWLVLLALALSPAELLTRVSLLAGIAAGLVAAIVLWVRRDRPGPPSARPAVAGARDAIRRPVVAVLGVAVALGSVYSAALGLFTPVNEGDALAYHLARAAFWHQEHGLGYVAGAVDERLNANPPNAEVGQLATMLLTGGDRYAALPQLAAYAALVLCVAALARRLGLGVAEALFAAFAFATLPVVAVQASGALNDLVVASFLAVAVVFALRPGRASLVLLALALGLALGTKLTAVLALPTLAVVAALGRPRRDWPGLAAAGVGGAALGSIWYLVNLSETGEPDGGLAETFDQRVDLAAAELVVNALRFGLDLVDMSGAASPHDVVFVAAGAALAALGLLLRRLALLAAGALASVPYLAEQIADLGQRVVLKSWLVLGEPETAPFDDGWGLNVDADPVDSWFGPLGAILLVVGTGAALLLWRRKQLPRASLGLALAPWLFLLCLALTIVWDPWRGRFLVFAVALAAATWGALLRSPIVAPAIAAVGTAALALSLANYQSKPSGLGEVWASGDPPPPAVDAVWNDERWTVQTWLRPGRDREDRLLRFVEERIPDDASIAVALRPNDFVSPYFGERLSRRVSLVPPGAGAVPADAEWLVLSPESSAARCEDAWRRELDLDSGWRVERRIAAGDCPDVK